MPCWEGPRRSESARPFFSEADRIVMDRMAFAGLADGITMPVRTAGAALRASLGAERRDSAYLVHCALEAVEAAEAVLDGLSKREE